MNPYALYFIAGTPQCRGPVEQTLQQAIKGGVTMFQFREKGPGALQGSEKRALAERLQAICRTKGIPFIVKDDLALAEAIQADGVHIGQDDEPAHLVRERIKGGIVGVSVHTLAEFEQAVKNGADYVGTGPVFPTTTKLDTEPVAGTALIQMIKKQRPQFPVVGIGGINEQNARAVIEAGADGIALITAISQSDDPEQAARQLKNSAF